MKQLKFDIVLADLCMSDFWCGHHLAVIQVPVYKNMMLQDLKIGLLNELNIGGVNTNQQEHLMDGDCNITDEAFEAFEKAINDLAIRDGGNDQDVFPTLEELEDGDHSECVSAFFIFVEEEMEY